MPKRLDFAFYLLNESRVHLSQKVGDILSALQSLHEDADHLGTRQLMRAAQGIVGQIRRIIKDNWPDSEINTLQALQRIAVALIKAIDENTNLQEVIATAVEELQQTSNKSGEPANTLGPDEESPNP